MIFLKKIRIKQKQPKKINDERNDWTQTMSFGSPQTNDADAQVAVSFDEVDY